MNVMKNAKKCMKKMKNTDECMQRKYVGKNFQVKGESEKMASIYRQKLWRAKRSCRFTFSYIG